MKKLLCILLGAFLVYIALYSLKQILSRSSGQVIKRPTASIPAYQRAYLLGFVPYWQITDVKQEQLSIFDEVIYFGLTVNGNGEIVGKDTTSGSAQGYRVFLSAQFQTIRQTVQANNAQLTIALVLQDNDAIKQFLANKIAQDRLWQTTSTLLASNPSFGINLDLEYAGIPDRNMVQAYTQFVRDFGEKLRQTYPNSKLSIDVAHDSIQKSRIYDVGKLAESSDHIILMGYDFYKVNSSVAGPVAPLFGKEQYDYDVSTAVSDFLTAMPKGKLLLGVPYYGWDYPTQTESKGSFVRKQDNETTALSSYKRNLKLLSQGATKHLDEESQTPWLSYTDRETGIAHQVWYEDEVSLGKKYDLIKKAELAGVAVWTLGYDNDTLTLFELLKKQFR